MNERHTIQEPQKPTGPYGAVSIPSAEFITLLDRLCDLANFKGTKGAMLAAAKECHELAQSYGRDFQINPMPTIPKGFADEVAELHFRIERVSATVKVVVEYEDHDSAAIWGLADILEDLMAVSRKVWIQLDEYDVVEET